MYVFINIMYVFQSFVRFIVQYLQCEGTTLIPCDLASALTKHQVHKKLHEELERVTHSLRLCYVLWWGAWVA